MTDFQRYQEHEKIFVACESYDGMKAREGVVRRCERTPSGHYVYDIDFGPSYRGTHSFPQVRLARTEEDAIRQALRRSSFTARYYAKHLGNLRTFLLQYGSGELEELIREEAYEFMTHIFEAFCERTTDCDTCPCRIGKHRCIKEELDEFLEHLGEEDDNEVEDTSL